jgi:hypothetical protein
MLTPKQITHAPPGSWIGHEYASICPFNSDNTRLLLIHIDHFELYDGDGVWLATTPLSPTSEPRWSTKNPHLLYYRTGNAVMSFDVREGTSTYRRKFPKFTRIYGKGESDINENEQLVLAGDDQTILAYDLKNEYVSRDIVWPRPFGQLYITPDNNVLVGDATGMYILDPWNGGEPRKVAQTEAHQDVCRDNEGQEVLIRINAADPSGASITTCPNGVEKTRLIDGDPECLWSIGWKPHAEGGGAASQAVHISCPDQKGWCLVSTYSPQNADPSRVYKVPFDGSGAEQLCETGSVMIRNPNEGTTSYNPQPKASVSRDGSRFVFSSNNGDTSRGPDYCDVFLGTLQEAPKPVPQPVLLDSPALPGFKKVNLAQFPAGQEWIWHFKLINGQMIGTLYDKD